MSKKSNKMGFMQQESSSKKLPAREMGSSKRIASGKRPKASTAKPAARAAASQTAVRSPERPVNLTMVRVSAILTAVIALGAGILWIIQVQGNPPTGVIIGLLALGFVAGLCIFVATRAEEVVKRARSAMRR